MSKVNLKRPEKLLAWNIHRMISSARVFGTCTDRDNLYQNIKHRFLASIYVFQLKEANQ